VLKDGDQIRTVVEAVGVNDVLPQINALVKTVDTVIGQDIRQVIQALKKDLSELVAEVKKLATGPVTDAVQNTNRTIVEVGGSVNRLVNRLDRIAGDLQPLTASASKDVTAIVKDVRAMTDRLRQTVASTDAAKPGLVDRVERIAARLEKSLDQVTGKVEKAVADVPAIASNVKKITADAAHGKGLVGTFLTDEALASTVKETVNDAGKFISGLTGLQTIVGLRSEYNVLANSLKTYVSIRLQPKEDKYYLIELIDDPRGKRTATSTVTRSDDPSKPVVTRTEEVKVTDDFKFSFMFAKRVSFATFRFGIKENTGGLGLDLAFFRDRLMLSTDIFDFQANVFPRLKLSASWMFYPRLYLVAGTDDVLNARARTGAGGGRDYFVGAMLMFNDQDLKSLLLFAGSALGALGK
jgi:phospholipid/cholesterol/gamma-HCH transport system substrate-binding protein